MGNVGDNNSSIECPSESCSSECSSGSYTCGSGHDSSSVTENESSEIRENENESCEIRHKVNNVSLDSSTA